MKLASYLSIYFAAWFGSALVCTLVFGVIPAAVQDLRVQQAKEKLVECSVSKPSEDCLIDYLRVVNPSHAKRYEESASWERYCQHVDNNPPNPTVSGLCDVFE